MVGKKQLKDHEGGSCKFCFKLAKRLLKRKPSIAEN